jgi:hypothetical protein
MPEVVGDPDDIEAFARELSDYCQSTQDNLQRIRGRLTDMESQRAWADDRYRRYMEMFEEVSGRIQRTLDEFRDEHMPHLQGVVQRLRAYHEG